MLSAPPSTANGIKPRPRKQQPNGDRYTASKSPMKSGNSFNRIIFVVFLVAVADVLFVWHSVNLSIGGVGDDEAHRTGAEAGLHHLHERKRRKTLNEHILASSTEEDTGRGRMKPSSNATIITVNSNGDVIKKVTRVMEKDEARVTNVDGNQVDERIMKIVQSADIHQLDEATTSQLPTWDDVTSQYGEEPIIYGLETCEPYRESIKPEDRMVGPAGIFNTGTNLLFVLMRENCVIREARDSKTHQEPKRNGVRWQVPWGKHK